MRITAGRGNHDDEVCCIDLFRQIFRLAAKILSGTREISGTEKCSVRPRTCRHAAHESLAGRIESDDFDCRRTGIRILDAKPRLGTRTHPR